MKILLRSSVVGSILVLALGVSACASSKRATSAALPATSVVSDVQEFEVDGIPVLLRTSTAAPVVSAILFVKGGSTALKPDDPISLEYFAMNVAAASGSQRIGKSYFRRKMVSMGTNISGDDGRDFSALSLRCTRESFDTSWAYFADIATRPAFDQTEFDNFRKSVLVGLASRKSDPDVYSNVVADSIYFQGHPYGRILNAEDVMRPTIQSIAEHFKGIMVKSRFLLSVVGNISRAELEKKVHETIGRLPVGTYTPITMGPPPKAFSPSVTYPAFDRALPTDYVLGYYLIPSMGDSDYYPYLRLRNFFGGFVFNHIRVQHNLAYAPNVDDKEGSTSVGVISLQTPYVDSAIKLIDKDIEFFQDNTIREAAIRDGVARWTTNNYMKAETTQSQAALLGRAKLYTGDWRNAFVSFSKLANVTPMQLVHAARTYLRNINWVVVGDTTNIDKQLLLAK
jgi:zinc protease